MGNMHEEWEQNPTPLSALVGTGAWFGLLLERLRTQGTPLVPFLDDPMEDQHTYNAEAERLGARRVNFGWPWESPDLPAIDGLVRDLYEITREKDWQEGFWSLAVQPYAAVPYPIDVARDMVRRPFWHSNLAHSMQHEEIWFAVAPEWPEAASKLAASRYDNPAEPWDRVLEIIADFSHRWFWSGSPAVRDRHPRNGRHSSRSSPGTPTLPNASNSERCTRLRPSTTPGTPGLIGMPDHPNRTSR